MTGRASPARRASASSKSAPSSPGRAPTPVARSIPSPTPANISSRSLHYAVAVCAALVIAACSDNRHVAVKQPSADASLCAAGAGLVRSTLAAYPDRPLLLQAPATGGRGRPLVIALHGSGAGPKQMEAMTHLARRGAAAGVNVVLPSASERIWHNFSISDEPYLDAVIDDALRRTCADPHALVLTGFSNGGDEAQTIGCVEAARGRAGVVVSSSTVPDRCIDGGPPVSLLRVHGLLDRLSPFGGRGGIDPRDAVVPATTAWAAYDGCPGPPVRTGISRRWSGCAAGTFVQLITLPRGGHAWPTEPDVTGLVIALAQGRKAASGG